MKQRRVSIVNRARYHFHNMLVKGTIARIIISSLTTRYRDLNVLVGFGVSLWMYVTPVVYPLDSVSGPLRWLILANPATAPIEYLRSVLLGVGGITAGHLVVSTVVTCVVLFVGMVVFTKVERTFMDTI